MGGEEERRNVRKRGEGSVRREGVSERGVGWLGLGPLLKPPFLPFFFLFPY